MPKKNSQTAYPPTVQTFINVYLKPQSQPTKERIVHWLEVFNNPEQFKTDTLSVAETRRRARNNLIRLVRRNPGIADTLIAKHLAGGAK